MRLKGQQSNTGLKLAMLIGVLIALGVVIYFLYLAPR